MWLVGYSGKGLEILWPYHFVRWFAFIG